MFVFIKAQFASVFSTLIDFFVTVFFVEIVGTRPVLATVIGAAFGAVTNFLLGRIWVFKAKEARLGIQFIKYGIVWVGSVSLNALGMFLLTDLMHVQYVWSKIVTSVAVGVGYNFILQRNMVFRTA